MRLFPACPLTLQGWADPLEGMTMVALPVPASVAYLGPRNPESGGLFQHQVGCGQQVKSFFPSQYFFSHVAVGPAHLAFARVARLPVRSFVRQISSTTALNINNLNVLTKFKQRLVCERRQKKHNSHINLPAQRCVYFHHHEFTFCLLKSFCPFFKICSLGCLKTSTALSPLTTDTWMSRCYYRQWTNHRHLNVPLLLQTVN